MSQNKFVMGDWRAHTSEHIVNYVASGNHLVFAACPSSLLEYNVLTGEMSTYSKVNGLSDVNISIMKYNDSINKLVIGYTDGNIDIMSNDNDIYNISDIANASSLTSKKINNITFASDTAYLACDYGISIINLTKKEVQETYFLGTNTNPIKVNDLVLANDTIWVATNNGVYHALEKNTNLHDFSNWIKLKSIPHTNEEFSFIESIGDKLYIAYKGPNTKDDKIYIYKNGKYTNYDTTFQYDVNRLDTKGIYTTLIASNRIDMYDTAFVFHTDYYGKDWATPYDAVASDKWHTYIADKSNELIQSILYGKQKEITPNSPYRDYINSITVDHGTVYVTGGTPNLKYNKIGMYRFSNNRWFNYNMDNYQFLDSIPNLNLVAVDPRNPNHYAASSNGYGVVEFQDTSVVNTYDERNSSLKNITSFTHGYIDCTGIQYDNDGDLWVLTSRSTHPLNLKKANGEWQSFNMDGLLQNHATGKMMKTPWGDIWFVDKDYGFVIFNPDKLKNGDLDNGIKRMQLVGGDNKIIDGYCTCMTIDNENTMWFGLSSGGIGVYYSPESVFYNDYLYVSKIIVEGDGITNYLLDKEFVTSIKVDGANRKWIGTEKGGAFLISPTGTEQVFNLNTENSPLLSNYIYDIGINQQTGEIFFGTIKGIVSYFSGTTEGETSMDNLTIYPNPITPDYTGKITISGLMYNSVVKITDVAGNIIFQTNSNGGTALWNMKDFNNVRVNTGVYLVYGSPSEGQGKATGKIFVISK